MALYGKFELWGEEEDSLGVVRYVAVRCAAARCAAARCATNIHLDVYSQPFRMQPCVGS